MPDLTGVPAPGLTEVMAYIATTKELHSEDAAAGALATETAAQARICRVPPATEAVWPADLAEALCRRVVVNLNMRKKPLGVEAAISEGGVGFARVSGNDPEVRRLERPWRRKRRPIAG